MTTMSSREFNQDAGKAKRLAMQGPVFITDRGRLAHVLLTIEEYQKITATHRNMADMLGCPERVRRLILSRPPYRRPYLRMWIYHDVSC